MPIPATAPDEGSPRSRAAIVVHTPRRGLAPLGHIVPVFEVHDPQAHRRLAITAFVLLALIGGFSFVSNVWGG